MVYLCTLERFGYVLTLVEKSEQKARETMIRAYNTIYKQNNGCRPSAEELEWAINDIGITAMECGKVEWM